MTILMFVLSVWKICRGLLSYSLYSVSKEVAPVQRARKQNVLTLYIFIIESAGLKTY